MKNEMEMLGVMMPRKDKDVIREIARKNNVPLSILARMLIANGLKHANELKMVVE